MPAARPRRQARAPADRREPTATRRGPNSAAGPPPPPPSGSCRSAAGRHPLPACERGINETLRQHWAWPLHGLHQNFAAGAYESLPPPGKASWLLFEEALLLCRLATDQEQAAKYVAVKAHSGSPSACKHSACSARCIASAEGPRLLPHGTAPTPHLARLLLLPCTEKMHARLQCISKSFIHENTDC